MIGKKCLIDTCIKRLQRMSYFHFFIPRKFYIKSNNEKVDSFETGCIVIADLIPWSDLENCMYTILFQLMTIKFYRHYFICRYNFNHSHFRRTNKLTNNIKPLNFKGNFFFQTLSNIFILTPLTPKVSSKTDSSWFNKKTILMRMFVKLFRSFSYKLIKSL